jgi:2-polyprenyl-6-methoxyphenol hydroxylase-like FAD-dependent oxidoreductase
MTYMAWPTEELDRLRSDVEGNLLATLDRAGTLGERVRAGRRAERIRTVPDLPSYVRAGAGPNWALAGDAGLLMDPITGAGIGHALRDAELLSEALVAGFTGTRPLAAALADYDAERDRQTLPLYEFTRRLAALPGPTPEARVLFGALAEQPEEVRRFLGVLTGIESPDVFFGPAHVRHLLGLRGLARIVTAKVGAGMRRRPVAPAA